MSVQDRMGEAFDKRQEGQSKPRGKSGGKAKTAVHRKAYSYHVDVELQDAIDKASYEFKLAGIPINRAEFRERVLRAGMERLNEIRAAYEWYPDQGMGSD